MRSQLEDDTSGASFTITGHMNHSQGLLCCQALCRYNAGHYITSTASAKIQQERGGSCVRTGITLCTPAHLHVQRPQRCACQTMQHAVFPLVALTAGCAVSAAHLHL